MVTEKMREELRRAEKRILKAVRMLRRRVSEEEALDFGEESFEKGIAWGDALIQFSRGFFYASACIEVEKPMEDVLPLLAGEKFVAEFIEAPSKEKFREMKHAARKKILSTGRRLKAAEKTRAREKAAELEKELEKNEKRLLAVEVAERLSLELGCVKRYVVTTARDRNRGKALEKLRLQARRVLFRAGGRMLKEREIKKCFKWEEAVRESFRLLEEKIPRIGEALGVGSG